VTASNRYGLRIAWMLGSVLLPGADVNPPGNGILFRDSFTVPAQQHFFGNLIAVDSAVSLEAGSTLDGNLILIGGTLQTAGEVTGDIASLDGSIRFASSAAVGGDVVSIGKAPVMDTGVEIGGTVHVMEGFAWHGSSAGEISPVTGSGDGRSDIGYAFTVILFRMFLLSAVAIITVLFLPLPTSRVARTMLAKPAISLLIGLLTMMAAIALFLLLALTVCLSPIGLLGGAVLFVASLLGWVAMGRELGSRGSALLGFNAHPAVTAGVGTAALTLAASGLGYIPFAGPILILVLASFGLGAVVLTRFGGPEYQILPEKRPVELSNEKETFQ
jgi:hypothetical protein